MLAVRVVGHAAPTLKLPAEGELPTAAVRDDMARTASPVVAASPSSAFHCSTFE